MFRLLSVLIALIIIPFGSYLFNKATDGFSLHEIKGDIFDYRGVNHSFDHDEVACALDQPFRYLGKGIQSYAFESQDGTYVLKFFKHKHLRSLSWLNAFPGHAFLQEKIKKREARVLNLFSSCDLTFSVFKEECGLLLVHLDKEKIFDQKVVLIDKLGIKRTIDLNDYECVLQKRGEMLEPLFTNATDTEIETRLRELAHLVARRCECGIGDRDPSFVKNVAFLEGRAIFIDIGTFYFDESLKIDEAKKREVVRRLECIRSWAYEKGLTQVIPPLDKVKREFL